MRKNDGRVIKRYANRKLYDVEKSRYITLDGIRELVQTGEDVRVVDNRTGEDLTGVTFAQIIYEAEKRRNGVSSLPLLRRMVEIGDETVQRSREALENVREAAEKSVRRLVSGEDAARLLEDIQHRIDQQVRQSVERVTNNPVLKQEIHKMEKNMHRVEKRLAELTGAVPPKRPAKRRKTTKKRSRARS